MKSDNLEKLKVENKKNEKVELIMFKKMLVNLGKVENKSIGKEFNRCVEYLNSVGAYEVLEYMEELKKQAKENIQAQGITTTTDIDLNKSQFFQVTFTKESIQIDSAKVKAIPNWEEKFGKKKSAYYSVTGIKTKKDC
jgi:hypothetical protein